MFKTIRNLVNSINYPIEWKDAVIVEEVSVPDNIKEIWPFRRDFIVDIDGGKTDTENLNCTGAMDNLQVGDHVKVLLTNHRGSNSKIVWVKERNREIKDGT